MINLNLNHLFYFWKIAQKESISKAAEDLNISKSSLSSQMKILEQSVDFPLFNRKGRSLELTWQAKSLFDYCDEIFLKATELDQIIFSKSISYKGKILKMAVAYNTSAYLKFLIKNFFDEYGYQVHFGHYDEKQVLEIFQDKNYDLMLSSMAHESSLNQYTIDQLTRSPYVMVQKALSPLMDPLYLTIHIANPLDAKAIKKEVNRNQKNLIIQRIDIQNDMELAKLFLFEKNQILCSSELNLYNEIHKGQVKKIKTLNCFEDQYLYTKQNDEILKLKEKLIQELKKIMPALTPKHS